MIAAKIAFGPGGIAYATTAALGVAPEGRAGQPMAGDIFAFDLGVAGQPAHAIAHL